MGIYLQLLSGFQLCRKTEIKTITMANRTNIKDTANQWEYDAKTRRWRQFQARENVRDVQVAAGIGFESDWLDKWHEFLF